MHISLLTLKTFCNCAEFYSTRFWYSLRVGKDHERMHQTGTVADMALKRNVLVLFDCQQCVKINMDVLSLYNFYVPTSHV